jgi:hypothetical protein
MISCNKGLGAGPDLFGSFVQRRSVFDPLPLTRRRQGGGCLTDCQDLDEMTITGGNSGGTATMHGWQTTPT